METGAPNSGVVNMTRAREALSPMLNNPRKTITRVEVLVSVAAALLLLQFILGVCKRLWHNSIVSFVLKVCNKAMFPFIIYILGTMQTSPIKNSVYPVWAVSLIIASEATGAVKPPDRFNIENLMSIYSEVARYAFYFTMFSQLLNPSNAKFRWPLGHTSSNFTYYLFALVVLSKLIVGVGGLMLGFSHCVVLARWMNKKANSDNHSDCDYPVRYSFNVDFKRLSESQSNVHVTTVNDIYGCFQNRTDGTPIFPHQNRLKDVCLSFAFFQLLKRRYFGMFCAEASLSKTKEFVLKELFPNNDYKRAFRIVETELGLLYDFLFTKHQLIYTTGLFRPLWISLFVLFLGKIILIFVVGMYALKSSLVLETPSPIIEVHSVKADYIIALAFICIILMVYLLQAAFYVASDWFKVSLICMYYVKRKSCAPIALILEKFVGFLYLCRINISAGCRNTIGQTSFISDLSNSTPFNKFRTPAVKVSDAVKKAMANAVKEAIGNSLKSAPRMFDEYSQTWKDHSEIEVMLIWHIATDYCHLVLSGDDDRQVAVNLSRYYAYLIAFVPELLPYHMVDINELRGTVREEIESLPSRRSFGGRSIDEWVRTECLGPYMPSKMLDIMKNLKGTSIADNPTTVFMKGVKLGKQLEEGSKTNGVEPWKMLAEFWAETIVYITPSHHTAKHHMEHLESGGEFLTKIWVLLSHAGILNLDREKQGRSQPIKASVSAPPNTQVSKLEDDTTLPSD